MRKNKTSKKHYKNTAVFKISFHRHCAFPFSLVTFEILQAQQEKLLPTPGYIPVTINILKAGVLT